jgi:hypothetical protein
LLSLKTLLINIVLQKKHPIDALLNHHFRGNLSKVIFGFEAILGNRTASDTNSALGGFNTWETDKYQVSTLKMKRFKIS